MFPLGVLALGASALAASVSAQGTWGQKYLWGADGMGKVVKRVASPATSAAPKPDSTCTHGPRNRACWNNGFSVATDFDQKHPTNGKTRSYTLEITNTTCSPDGLASQPCYLINGQYPGPTIFADWGDYLSITVKNSMQDNGTSMHWHGIRQLNTNGYDGVNGITECPIAPGQSFTYKWQATQFGTSWYHSHFSTQYGNGVVGPIVINGPSTSNYDIDLGSFFVNDWYYADVWATNERSLQLLQKGQPPPPSDNILINGTGKSASGSGKYAQIKLQAGKKHKLRLVNPSVDNYIKVKLDGHPFTVIAADFIPTIATPGQDWLQFGPGQRYEVIISSNQTSGSFWFRAEVAKDCLSAGNKGGRALFTYDTDPKEPVDSNEAPPQDGCTEFTTTPFWDQPVDKNTFQDQVKTLTTDLTTAPSYTTNGQNLVVWALNLTSMNIDWNKPTLQYVMSGNASYPKQLDVIEIPNEGVWTYWIIQTLQQTQGPNAIQAPPPPHPIHLHGHDFFVLGSGKGQFDAASANLNFTRPARRDTATLPSVGWLALAFPANNPGAWLMHCHISWHISQGLGVQFLEAKNQIVMPDRGPFNQQCTAWAKYAKTAKYPKPDSGL